MIKEFRGKYPVPSEGVHIAASADLVGDIVLAEGVNVWYGAVLRADEAPVSVGRGTNVQDGVVIHTAPDYPVSIGADVTVGHRSIIHGCTVGDGALIGMGAILLNGCIIGEGSIVAAGSVVTEGAVVPPKSLAMGIPARVVRPLREEEMAASLAGAAEYVRLSAEQLPPAAEVLS